MKRRNSIILFASLGLSLFSLSPIVSAAGLIPCGIGDKKACACTLCDFIILAHNIFSFGLKLLVIVALVGIAIGGVMYILATGNETAITKAKGFLWSSIGGFAIVLAAWLIVSIAMWFISTKDDLGIGAKSWSTFECTEKPASCANTAPEGDSGLNNGGSGGGFGGGGGGSY